jgi:hypothetical protein
LFITGGTPNQASNGVSLSLRGQSTGLLATPVSALAVMSIGWSARRRLSDDPSPQPLHPLPDLLERYEPSFGFAVQCPYKAIDLAAVLGTEHACDRLCQQ